MGKIIRILPVDFMFISVLGPGDIGYVPPVPGSCNEELKGDGQCDEVNDKAKCDWDYGDCCKKNWIGNGRCNARNNFIGCTNNTGTGQDKYDGGDCFVRECLMDKDDPLDGVYSQSPRTDLNKRFLPSQRLPQHESL